LDRAGRHPWPDHRRRAWRRFGGDAGLLKRRRRLSGDRAALLTRLGAREAGLDQTASLGIRLCNGRFLQLRPVGNAPGLRVYAEAGSREAAEETPGQGLAAVAAALGP
jgi:phosphomannomutase